MDDDTIVPYRGKRTFNDVLRKRVVIELITAPAVVPFAKSMLERYLVGLSQVLRMTIINGPVVHSWAKDFRPDSYDGYEGLIMWAESGAQLYTWERFRAITVDVFSCKEFSIAEAVGFTRQALHAEQIAWREIEPVLRVVTTEDETVADVSAAGV